MSCCHGGINALEVCFFEVLRSGNGRVQKTENKEVKKKNQSGSDHAHKLVRLHRKNHGVPDKQADVVGPEVV
jgi:hypothetical protein